MQVVARYIENGKVQSHRFAGHLAGQHAEQIRWIDVQYQPDEANQVRRFLKESGCHELAINDVLRPKHPPKVELFDDCSFIIFRGVKNVNAGLEVEHRNVAFFIFAGQLITVHKEGLQGLDALPSTEKIVQSFSDSQSLACAIMHELSATYLNELLDFEERLEDIEENFFEQGDDRLLAQLNDYKLTLIRLTRIFNYHVSITTSLQKGLQDKPFEFAHKLRDLHDRFERLSNLSHMFYEICDDLINGYLSISSHRLNNTMQMLTVITAVFVPLSFLAGLYGMNFSYMPELQYRYSYFILLGVMLALVIGLITYFKYKKWF